MASINKYVNNEIAQLMAADLYSKMEAGGIFYVIGDENSIFRMHIEDPDVGVVFWSYTPGQVPTKLLEGGLEHVYNAVHECMAKPYFDVIEVDSLEVSFMDVLATTVLGDVQDLKDEIESLETTVSDQESDLEDAANGASSLQGTIQDIRDALAEFNKAAETFNSSVESAVNDSYDYL